MIIEATTLNGLPIHTDPNTTVGQIDLCVVDGKEAKLSGFQVLQPGVVKRFSGLFFQDVAQIHRDQLIIDSSSRLQKNLKLLDDQYKMFGKVIGSSAKTESGVRLGRVTDYHIDTESGIITRFVIGTFLHERIIPRQFLVSITPKAVIFKDIVNQPIFDQVAASEASV